jgi:hypothetical protein
MVRHPRLTTKAPDPLAATLSLAARHRATSSGPSLVQTLTGSGNVVLGGASMTTLTVTAAASVYLLRTAPARAVMLTGRPHRRRQGLRRRPHRAGRPRLRRPAPQPPDGALTRAARMHQASAGGFAQRVQTAAEMK